MEQNTNYQVLREVISQCTTQLTNIDLQQQEYHIQRREIEEHFERCIHALEARRTDLLNQLDLLKNESSEVIQTKLATHISICKDILKTGCNIFNASSASADTIWQEALKLEQPSIDGASIKIILPDILTLLSRHGSITAISNGSTLLVNTVSTTNIVQDYEIESSAANSNESKQERYSEFAKVDKVETFVGYQKGLNTQFVSPSSLCFNPYDDCLYVTDKYLIRKITLNGYVETAVSTIKHPKAIAMNYREQCFYVVANINSMYKVTLSGSASDFALKEASWFKSLKHSVYVDLAIDQYSGNMFVCDNFNHLIRKITPQGEISTLAGSKKGFADGCGEKALFSTPNGIWFDEPDQSLVVADFDNNKLRRVTLNGNVSTICTVPSPNSIVITNDRSFIVSSLNKIFRAYHEGEGYKVEMLAGEMAPRGIVVHSSTRTCFVADCRNGSVCKLTFEASGKL